jgi:DnaJ-class molecular chaperone
VEELKARYRQLALKHHPDRAGDLMQFMAVQEAFEQAKKLRGWV